MNFSNDTVSDFVNLIDSFDIKGVPNIEAVPAIALEPFFDATNGDAIKESKENVIYTSGVNLTAIRYIPGIDIYRSYSNDVKQMFDNFGIEFARSQLFHEFTKAYENAGNKANPQHISLLVDMMCYTGVPLSVDRHGMKSAAIDPLSKASFEKPIETFFNAAFFGESDKQEGVSSRIYTGQLMKGGTGYIDVVIDTNMIKNSEFVAKSKEARDKTYDIKGTTIADLIMKEDGESDVFIPGM